MTSKYHHRQPTPMVEPSPSLVPQSRSPRQQDHLHFQRAYSSDHPSPVPVPAIYSSSLALRTSSPMDLATSIPNSNMPQGDGFPMPPSYLPDSHLPKPLAFHALLQAPTAITPKTDDVTVTYLNRGQWYVIELTDQHRRLISPITSTVSIMFHNPAHRRAASNYWKFWLNQQKDACEARVIDLGKPTANRECELTQENIDTQPFRLPSHLILSPPPQRQHSVGGYS
ncbi:CP2 transcription factor-domain-containing protein [Dichotomocladium elegans]|nr:CP2 transcription factor-domain-containing protein [Dichotomocladium elegans]